MQFGFMAFTQATTVLLAGVIEGLVPVVSRSMELAALQLSVALRGARTLDAVLAKVDTDGGDCDRDSARNVAKNLSDSLLAARSKLSGLTTSTQRALDSTCDCARALHRTLASPRSSEVMGARILAHGLDTASALAGVLTLELGSADENNAHCDQARGLTLSLARARDLAADADLPNLVRELDRARSLSLSLATTPDAGERGMPLWIFFALGRALGRLDVAFEKGDVASGGASPEEFLVVDLDLPVEASHVPVAGAAADLCTSLGELHVVLGGSSLVPLSCLEPQELQPGRKQVEIRLAGADSETQPCKPRIVQLIQKHYSMEATSLARQAGLKSGGLKSPSWTPLDVDEVVAGTIRALEWAAFANEQGQLASRLAQHSLAQSAPSEESGERKSPWSAPTQRVVAAMGRLDRLGARATVRLEVGLATDPSRTL